MNQDEKMELHKLSQEGWYEYRPYPLKTQVNADEISVDLKKIRKRTGNQVAIWLLSPAIIVGFGAVVVAAMKGWM